MEGPAEGEGKPTTTSVFPEFEIVIEEERGGTDEEKAARKKYASLPPLIRRSLFVVSGGLERGPCSGLGLGGIMYARYVLMSCMLMVAGRTRSWCKSIRTWWSMVRTPTPLSLLPITA